jgi:crotonobetainyl-CoA:carnitine CoA-transferase CaiB-like acyl-CoA transferase
VSASLELRADQIAQRTTQEWLELLRELEIRSASLSSPASLFDDRHLSAVGVFRDGGHTKRPSALSRCADLVFAKTGRVAGPAPSWAPTPRRYSKNSASPRCYEASRTAIGARVLAWIGLRRL